MRLFLITVVILAAAGIAGVAGYSAIAGVLATVGAYVLAGFSLVVVVGLLMMMVYDCRLKSCQRDERKRWEQAQHRSG